MEFPDDDSLDDLLCDSSANKFKRPPAKAVTLVPTSSEALESKRLKKSALMAELFGPTTFHHFDSDQEQQVHPQATSNRSPSVPLSSVSGQADEPVSVSKIDTPVLGGYTPTLGIRKNPAQHAENPHESSRNMTDEPPLGSYTPTLGRRNRETPSEPKPTHSKLAAEVQSADDSADKLAAAPISASQKATGAYSPSARDSRRANPTPNSLPLAFQPVEEPGNATKTQASSEPGSHAQLSWRESQRAIPAEKTTHLDAKSFAPLSTSTTDLKLFKELLDSFTAGFFSQFSSLNSKEEALKEITSMMVSVEKSLGMVSRTLEEKTGSQSMLLEKRVLSLEASISDLVKENANLVVRVQILENESSRNTNDVSALKSETVSLNALNQRCVSETEKVRDEINRLSKTSEQAKEVLHQSSQEQIKHLESKLDTLQRETSHILKAEVKWLEKQKQKLKRNSHSLHQLIHSKFQQLDEFSSVNWLC